MPRSTRTSGQRDPARRRVRYAVVGLGHIAQTAVLPGIAHAKRNSQVAALFSDDAEKLELLGRKYDVDARHGYGDYDQVLRSGEVDAVYIALPNDQHAEYAIRAANAGVHVLCEKPMAVTAARCEEMIYAARTAGVRLMIAYRLHFERANLDSIATAGAGRLGELRFFSSVFSMQVTPGDIRTRPSSVGGGSVYDLGIYCINAARYLFRDEPIAVTAVSASKAGDQRFATMDEMTSAVLRFPGDRLASFTCSFGAAATAAYDLVGTTGCLRMEQAYEHQSPMKRTLTVNGRTTVTRVPIRDQFAAEVDYFSECVLGGRDPEPSGEEGLADVRVIEAILESARSGHTVELPPPVRKERHPDKDQEIQYPRAPEPSNLVHVTSPSQED
jgi:predicted dehydrogenase